MFVYYGEYHKNANCIEKLGKYFLQVSTRMKTMKFANTTFSQVHQLSSKMLIYFVRIFEG